MKLYNLKILLGFVLITNLQPQFVTLKADIQLNHVADLQKPKTICIGMRSTVFMEKMNL